MTTLPPDQGFETVDCTTLDEFWDFLSPIGKHFGQPHSKFAFRGQRRSEWKLIPRIFRPEVLKKYKRGIMSTFGDYPGHFFFEWFLLFEFIHYCDARGLAIPGDSMDFRAYFSQNSITNLHGITSELWPEERVVPLMALAQHHGLPTRLLDWSSHSYVGCYFAAASAVSCTEPLEDSDKLALFAIDLNTIHRVDGIKYVRVPGSTSANLSSQSGSFILVDNFGYRGQPFMTDVSLESKLTASYTVLKKFTLPTSLAGELLLRCHKFGVSAASVFPGYDGVAQAVLESTLASHFNK